MDTDVPTTIGVRALRADLAAAVRRAASGQATVVTLSGSPAARLGPLAAGDPPLDRLVASGAVLAPRRRTGWRPPTPIVVWSGTRLDRVLRDVR